jgi:CHAT domain-containing protein
VTKLPLLRRLGHLEVAREAGYRSPTVVHFATHGFSIRTDLKNESSLGAPVENPRATLRQSGLALAGASAWAGLVADGRMPESHDAVLDAVDVSGLDLRDTVLTVLSSCESGLGTVLAGEGVFGLQRAFLLAGTQGLTMALFPVGDGSTSVLMEAFYDALAGGASPAAALRAAQRRVRRKYPWAVCWGGVVTVGRSCILPPPFSP